MSRLHSERGSGAIAVTLALLIVALVYLGYHRMQDAMQAPRRAVTAVAAVPLGGQSARTSRT